MSPLPANRIETHENRISVVGRLGLSDFHRLLAAFHSQTTKRGYQDLVLDFSLCTAAFAGPMVSICSAIGALRFEGIDTTVILPQKKSLERLFLNANWACLLDPAAFEESVHRSQAHVPAILFTSPADQQAAVNRMLDTLLSSMQDISRPDLSALEWSLSEITDNVLTHSRSSSGGIVQLTNFRQKGMLEFVVGDSGVGIPTTLREGHRDIGSDSDALDRAIREGVTRDTTLGQGNGLHGAFQIARVSGGYFHAHSGYARLAYESESLHIRSEQIPCSGTLIVSCIDRSKPNVLSEALRFGGVSHKPVDYIETRYESSPEGEIVFLMREEASSFGSRSSGQPVRTKLANLIRISGRNRVIVDFSGFPCSQVALLMRYLASYFWSSEP